MQLLHLSFVGTSHTSCNPSSEFSAFFMNLDCPDPKLLRSSGHEPYNIDNYIAELIQTSVDSLSIVVPYRSVITQVLTCKTTYCCPEPLLNSWYDTFTVHSYIWDLNHIAIDTFSILLPDRLVNSTTLTSRTPHNSPRMHGDRHSFFHHKWCPLPLTLLSHQILYTKKPFIWQQCAE